MAATNPAATLSTANGLAKDVFGKVEDVRPDEALKFINRIKFDEQNLIGEKYSEVVWLSYEHGFTYNGTGGAKVTLKDSEVAKSEEATIVGNEIIFRTEITYKLLASTVGGGKKAFESYWSRALINARKSFNKRLEIAMLRGGSSLGTLSAVSGTSTTRVFTISTATFAPGHWVGMINCPLDAYNGASKLNTNADIKITAVDIKNKQLSVSGNSTDLTAIDSAGTATELYFAGSKGSDGNGLRTVANLTTSSYLGISGSTYPDVWNGTQKTVSGNLTWAQIQDGLEEAAGRGCEGPLILMVSNPAWNNLNDDLNALRVIDSSYKADKTELGTKQIKFNTVTGTVEVVPSSYIMYGEALAYPDPSESDIRRIGSSNVTFMTPGRGEEMFRHVDGANTVEFRAWSDQSLWTTDVRKCIAYTGITN